MDHRGDAAHGALKALASDEIRGKMPPGQTISRRTGLDRSKPDCDSSQWPVLSAVIVNWNRMQDVLAALRSLRRVDYPQHQLEILVVDNGSTDGSAEKLAHEPDVRLILLGYNAGPSAARNVGIREASGEYILLLDSDATLSRRGLRTAIERLQADRDIAIAGLKILHGHSDEIDQWIYAQPFDTHGQSMFDTYSFSAAGAILRSSAIRDADGFWERLFIYNEEVDLSIRMIRAGHRVVYLPDVSVHHHPSGDGRAGQAGYFRYQIRNWIWIFLRHYPALLCWWMILLYSSVYLIKGATNGRPLACAMGIVEGLGGLAIARQFGEKMSLSEANRVRSLNRRYRIRLWDIATKPVERETPLGMEETDDSELLAVS